VITLKQGAGRLIRDETDRGVLMICDPRLFSKGYGRRILKSLPSMKGTREIADVIAFFEAGYARAGANLSAEIGTSPAPREPQHEYP